MFINRKEEINSLEKFYTSKTSEFLVLYGRRRIGKTELLKEFAKDKKHFFFSATLSSAGEQLNQFTEKIYNLTKEPLLKDYSFPSWEKLIDYLLEKIAPQYRLIIIDEFPYLCMTDKSLPSILQKLWDEKGKSSGVFLILCGSYMSFMEKEVLSSKSPLYGRRTGQMILRPFKYNEIKEFFKSYSPEELVSVYSILGGTPAYLQKFKEEETIEDNVKKYMLNKNVFLYEEPEFLLMEELRDPSLYYSIIKSVAFGKTRLNEISLEIKEKNTKVNKYISELRGLNIIKRDLPVTEKQPHKSKKGLYFLEDNFFRFWFRFIYPNRSYLEENEIDYVWDKKIKPYMNDFAGFAFEDICRQKLVSLNKKNMLPFKFEKIGRWWDGKEEIDLVAMGENGEYLFCECKWSVKHVGISLFEKLLKKSNRINAAGKKYFSFFSRSGFSPDLVKLAEKSDNLFLFDYKSDIV